jgi:hypothetical protein
MTYSMLAPLQRQALRKVHPLPARLGERGVRLEVLHACAAAQPEFICYVMLCYGAPSTHPPSL